MRTLIINIVSILVSLVGGCSAKPTAPSEPTGERSAANAWLTNQFSTISLKNAIIEQHTLHPYHFTNNGADLNELGEHDQRVLAEHFKTNPGVLNVRRGDVSEDLYRRRLDAVSDALVQAGVDKQHIQLSDGLTGGEGIASDQMLLILARTKKSSGRKYSAITTSDK